MLAKYRVYDVKDLRVKMDAIKQEPRQWVLSYYKILECLFVRGRILDDKRRRWFLAHLRPKIRKLYVVRTYANMDELLVSAIEMEKVMGETGEMPFEPLKDELEDEGEDEMNEKETSTKRQIHTLNETLINFFKGSNAKELAEPAIRNSSSLCQLCKYDGTQCFFMFKTL
jgi:hypothetical protein